MHTARPSQKSVSDKDMFPLEKLLCIALLVNAQTPFLYYQINAPLTSIETKELVDGILGRRPVVARLTY